MQIEYVGEAPAGRRRHKYSDLITAITVIGTTNDQWIKVPLDEISGKDSGEKRKTVSQACRQAEIQIETRLDSTHIYVRRLRSEKGA